MELHHKKLLVYTVSLDIVEECYRLTKLLPVDERFNLVSQLRRACLSISMNIAEGSSRGTQKERKRYFEVARGSLVEVDTALTVCVRLKYLKEEQLRKLLPLMNHEFNMLSKMISTLAKQSDSEK